MISEASVAEHDIHGSAFRDLVLEMTERARKRLGVKQWRRRMLAVAAAAAAVTLVPESERQWLWRMMSFR